MKKYLFAIMALCFATDMIAQEQQKVVKASKDERFLFKNSVQLELGGHGVFYSLNYERNLFNSNHFKTSVQIGVAFYPAFIDFRSRLWVPVSFNQLFSVKQHHLEMGLGIVFTEYQNYQEWEGDMKYEKDLQPMLTGKIGYRYQKPGGRMQYKFLFTPLLDKEYGRLEFVPLGAFSIGYTFGK